MADIYQLLPRLDLRQKTLVGLSVLLSIWTIYLVLFSVRAGLSKIPGPWHARYMNVWMAYKAWRYASAENRYAFYKDLQTRYGDVVRTGPQTVVVLDPAAVPAIYGVCARLNKGPAYNAFRLGGENRSLLTISDETTHAKYKRLVSNAFSMSSMKAYEPHVDEMVGKFVGVLDKFATTEECIASMSSPKSLLGMHWVFSTEMMRVQEVATYSAPVSQMPWLHKVLKDNPRARLRVSNAFAKLVASIVFARLEAQKPPPGRPDLLAHFVETHAKSPELMDANLVLTLSSGNLVGGGLSPSLVLPEGQDRVFQEVKDANVTFPLSFDVVKDLPYLDGIIHEGFRLHTSTSSNLQRVTGPSGLELPNGVYLPPRTNVGCPASFIDREPRAFGEDAELFRPERWMQQEGESEQEWWKRRNLMNSTELSFGQGSSTCLGKNVSLLEFYKGVATLVTNFKFKALKVPKKGETWVRVIRR
ncbi:hypothetical protein PV10_07052 [Exophiala mesophila]|uniref:Uncharacterized protein n=1 Tax=Exophiala mesophila TaxID=212818 RepID=A0A0D1Z4G3_EXOME|nr:uncharacterized protein PV10_07052 [Exophiala mesophila]KIV89667.1 hypothetical protein PV10_07052 [Exophiala mesophila]